MASKRRSKALAAKRQRRARRFSTHGKGKSKYARKAKYLHNAGLWGFEVPSPKPW